METIKTCGACNTDKPHSEFYKLQHTSDGLNWRCIPCQNAYNREYNLRRTLAKCDPVVLAAYVSAPIDRLRKFAPKVQVLDTGCWLWLGNKHPDNGYPRVWFDKHDDRLAHRVSYEWAVGPIPGELVIDHLCRNRWCVNPGHMEPVTSVENVMRGKSVWAQNARKTHCKRGHAFTEANTYTYNGMRHCRECGRLRKAQGRASHVRNTPSAPPAR